MRAVAADEKPEPARFRAALKTKAGLTGEGIGQLFTTPVYLDLAQSRMALKEACGIEILDEDLFIPPARQEGYPQS